MQQVQWNLSSGITLTHYQHSNNGKIIVNGIGLDALSSRCFKPSK